MKEGRSSRTTDWLAQLARLQPWYVLTRYQNRFTRALFAFVNACISIGILAGIAFYAQQPMVFPSLGPSAFLFFYRPSDAASCPRNALLGHGVGVVIGLLSDRLFSLFLPGELGRILAVAVSLGVVSAWMIATDLAHPPAASTTLIVSMGLMSGGTGLAAILVGVLLLTFQAYVINRLSGVAFPIWGPLSQQSQEGLAASALQTQGPAPEPDLYRNLADKLVARKPIGPPKKRT
ncbi:MAG: HPP family protein [Acidobacteriota bacterium]